MPKSKQFHHSSFWELLKEYPPCRVRICSKRPSNEPGSQVITNADIAAITGLNPIRVREISMLMNWDTVTISEMRLFCAANNFDPTNYEHRKRIAQYHYVCQKRNTPPFGYLKKSPRWEAEFLPIVRLMKQQKSSSIVSSPPTSHAAKLVA